MYPRTGKPLPSATVAVPTAVAGPRPSTVPRGAAGAPASAVTGSKTGGKPPTDAVESAPLRAPKRAKPPASRGGGSADGGGAAGEGAASTTPDVEPSPAETTLSGSPDTLDGGRAGARATGGGSGRGPPVGPTASAPQGGDPDGGAVVVEDSAGAPPAEYNREHNLSAVFGSSSGSKAAGSPGSAAAAGDGAGVHSGERVGDFDGGGGEGGDPPGAPGAGGGGGGGGPGGGGGGGGGPRGGRGGRGGGGGGDPPAGLGGAPRRGPRWWRRPARR